ncbi:MAG: hypothetical protein WA625_19305 [Pseudolabrys sp.]
MSDQKPDKIQQSKRGLLTNVTKYGWGREGGLRLEEIAPGQYAVRPEKPLHQQIADYISFWREWANSEIERAGKNPADYSAMAESNELDGACVAANVLGRLNNIEVYLKQIECDLADQSSLILIAIYEALLLVTDVHQLTVVDSEIAIASTQVRRKFLKKSRETRTDRAEKKRRLIQATAEKIWGDHPDWGNSAVANEIVKKDQTLKPDTVRRLIKHPQK